MKSNKVKKKQTPEEYKAQQARDFGRRAVANAYKSLFRPINITVIDEPRFIKLAEDTPNPHGNIAPPNTPVNGVRK